MGQGAAKLERAQPYPDELRLALPTHEYFLDAPSPVAFSSPRFAAMGNKEPSTDADSIRLHIRAAL